MANRIRPKKLEPKPSESGAWLDSLIGYPISLVLVAFAFYQISCVHVQYTFIDEIFHIPQAQKYCEEDFSHWDPKITTPPGLYFLAYLYKKALSIASPENGDCTIPMLRSLNVVAGSLILPAVIAPAVKKANSGFWSASVVLFPLLNIYHNLFYTDVWSTVWIMLSFSIAYTCPLGRGFLTSFVSAALALISLSFRQTNIIWTAFNAAIFLDQKIEVYDTKLFKKRFPALKGAPGPVLRIFITLEAAVHNVFILLPFLLNFALFGAFVLYNGGITFGDKENHVSTVHVPQVYYCLLFMALFGWPLLISTRRASSVLKYSFGSIKAVLVTLITYGGMGYTIERFTIVHPFLLADNRHYTFYLWRRLLDYSPYLRYMLVPIYHFLGALFITSLGENMSVPVVIAYVFCIFSSLVPSPLFEPRYYILPYLYWRVLVKNPANGIPVILKKYVPIFRSALEFLWSLLLDVVVLLIFLKVEFQWDSESEPQRIIW